MRLELSNEFEYDDVNIDKEIGISFDEPNKDEIIKPNKSDNIHQGKSFKDKFFVLGREKIKKTLTIVISGVILLVAILGLFFFFKDRQKPSADLNTGNQSLEQQTNNSNVGDSKSLFKKSIKQAIDSQAGKHEVSVAWRKATVAYIQDGDTDKFKNELKKINEDRIKLINAIPNDDNELNKLVIEGLNNQKDYMIKSYKVDNPEDASEIYNKFNESDKDYDKKYIEKLTSLLSENKIEYKINQTENGTEINY